MHCAQLELRCFNDKAFSFLTEYCKVLYPLVRGLNILPGEENGFYGTLLPTLVTITKRQRQPLMGLSTMTTGLVYAVEDSMKHTSVEFLIPRMPLFQ